MTTAHFVSDLHGAPSRYETLFRHLAENPPDILFMGGDLFPGALQARFGVVSGTAFIDGILLSLQKLKKQLGSRYPDIYVILGNDDGRYWEDGVLEIAAEGYWHYLHNRHVAWRGYDLFGYNYVPPTPFRLKDWERFDVSRYVDPGCSAPDEGVLSVPVSEVELNWTTIAEDLEHLTAGYSLERAIMLFHAPPYQTCLDRAALDGKMIDHAPLDVHVGSIAIRRLIDERQPFLTLHGHVHEASRITGAWSQRLGRTCSIGGAIDAPELALVNIPLSDLSRTQRFLL